MPEGETLPGRSGITDTLFDDCIRRPADGSSRDLPLVVLLGARGSGKTWVLEHLRNACHGSVAIPYTFLDCEAKDRSVWQLISDIADALHAEKWDEFGSLNFPRVTLGRLAAGGGQLPGNLTNAQDELRGHLSAAARLNKHVDRIDGGGTDVLQALDTPKFMISIARLVLRSAAESPSRIEYHYRTGLRWYGRRFGHSENSGLSALVELNRLYHTDDQRELADRMLCEAFLDDLNDAFTRRRKFNCAVLLDNCDDPAGTGFLNLLAERRSGRSGGDPLVVVATSRTVPDLTGLDRGWIFPWEPDQPGVSRVPNPDQAGYSSWQKNRAVGTDLAPWWYPVHLRDLTLPELRRHYEKLHLNHAPFIHRFTGGHPWSAYRVHKWDTSVALASKLSEIELLDVPAKCAAQAVEYLLADLPTALRANLMRWSAARDIGTAATLGGAVRDLRGELEKRLWLVAGNSLSKIRSGDPQLHPWLRRILLQELAATPETWLQVHRRLRDYSVQEGYKLDAAYHELACGELSPAVDYLAGQFGWMDANSWIQEFDAVTDAPNRTSAVPPVERYEKLVLEHDPLDRNDHIRKTLWSMVAARWIWSGQLGDPKVLLNDTIADGYVRLAEESRAGSVHYRREARAYREMRAW